MDKMERFVKAFELTQELAKDIPGIARINWSVEYYGETNATKRISRMVNEMQERNGNTSKE